jgi:AcrR family transcriptional regulator
VPYRRTPAVERRQAALRERLIAEATALVAEGGYAGCSVTQVARRAGVGVGTVYGYFTNKGELLAEVFRSVSSREVAAAVAAGHAVREDPSVCACAPIVEAVRTFAERAALAPRLAYALIAEPVDQAVDVERLVFRRAWTDLLAAAVADAVAAGHLPPQDPQVTAGALLGAAAEVLVQPVAGGTVDAGSYAPVVASLLTLTRRALGGTHDDDARGLQPGTAPGRARRR